MTVMINEEDPKHFRVDIIMKHSVYISFDDSENMADDLRELAIDLAIDSLDEYDGLVTAESDEKPNFMLCVEDHDPEINITYESMDTPHWYLRQKAEQAMNGATHEED